MITTLVLYIWVRNMVPICNVYSKKLEFYHITSYIYNKYNNCVLCLEMKQLEVGGAAWDFRQLLKKIMIFILPHLRASFIEPFSGKFKWVWMCFVHCCAQSNLIYRDPHSMIDYIQKIHPCDIHDLCHIIECWKSLDCVLVSKSFVSLFVGDCIQARWSSILHIGW